MTALEQFDNEMVKVVNRQLELGTKLSVEEIVKLSLNNMRIGNYEGITSSARPFFNSINVEKKLEEIMGCEFSSAVYIYSKRMDSFYKTHNMTLKLTGQIESMDELKEIVDNLSDNMDPLQLSELLKQAYYNNYSVNILIEQADDFMMKKGGTFLNDSIDNKINNFIKYVRLYHKLNVDDQYKSDVKENSKNIDNNLEILNISREDKATLLTDLYYGNDNEYLAYFQTSVEREDVMIALIRNVIQISIVSTNIRETSNSERILYDNARDMENSLMQAREVIGKIIGQDVNSDFVNLNPEQLNFNINNLTRNDINVLASLYVNIRKDEQSIDVVEKAANQSYKIEKLNEKQFSNDSELLKVVESKDFRDTLENQYQI